MVDENPVMVAVVVLGEYYHVAAKIRAAKIASKLRAAKERVAATKNSTLLKGEYDDVIDLLQDMIDDELDNPDVQAWHPVVAKLRAQRKARYGR